MENIGFRLIIPETPTRKPYPGQSPTRIDYCFTNSHIRKNSTPKLEVLEVEPHISDHNLLKLSLTYPSEKMKIRKSL